MITDFIPVETGYEYTVSENQTYTLPEGSSTVARACIYDKDKNFLMVAYQEYRYNTGIYTHSFNIPEEGAYIRCQFRITDTDIKIVKKKTNVEGTLKLSNLVYSDDSYTQGMCVSDEYMFVGYSASKGENTNDYQIRKLNRITGEIVATSEASFNHTNDMTYNKNTNEIIITGLNGNSTRTESASDEDYYLFVVDADTLTLKETVNLKDIITSVHPESIGLGGVSYNSTLDEYYILTRFEKRYMITLNSDFSFKSSVFFYNGDDVPGLTGGFTCDEKYFYLTTWRSDVYSNSLQNEIRIYDRNGNLIKTQLLLGETHIEGIDMIDDKLYGSFISFIVYPSLAKVYEIEKIQ